MLYRKVVSNTYKGRITSESKGVPILSTLDELVESPKPR